MGKGFASLGEKLADKKVPCRVRGCPRTWLWRSGEQVKAFSSGQMTPPPRMCDLCHARSQTLEDREVPCQTANCDGTVSWNRLSQLEAIIKHVGSGDPPPPRGMCEACRAKARDIADREVPCRVRGCTQAWTWSGRAQLQAGATLENEAEPPARMCDGCHEAYEQFVDERRPCKVKGCTRFWIYTRWQQVEAKAQNHGAPERMCDECVRELKTLADQTLPCRTDGCGGNWLWTRAQQLEAKTAGQTTAPARMCGSCQSKFSHLKDISVPCKRTGCKNTWVYKRGAQLERWIKHSEGPELPAPHRLCDTCKKRLDDFADREVACKTEGCKSTWTWTRFAQLQAAETGHAGHPPSHVCQECRDFLEKHHTKSIHCTRCNAEIHWAGELQLRTKLGLMREPTLCGSCKREETAHKVAL
jgi:hypothetical protein